MMNNVIPITTQITAKIINKVLILVFTPFYISNAHFTHLQIHKLLSSYQLILL
jgi:hypothetical protein